VKRRVAIVVGLGVVGVASFFLLHLSSHKLVLRAYFSDARNIRSGAAVRLAGVKVGTVRAVRIQPSMKDTPAELTMALDTGYDLRIPEDSVVAIQTAGVLGETYAEIEIAGTSGPPVSTNAILRSRQADQLSLNQVIERLTAALKKCSDQQPTKGNAPPAESGAGSTEPRSLPSH
jgi:phospholipid/cholesterol/gamma-HCH transport system substrate-binding protein